MPPIALATSQKYSQLTDDDRLLIPPLADLGYLAQPAVWSDASICWTDYAAVVIRSCWDYHFMSEQFLEWIASLVATGVRVLNSPELIRWNVDKIYLRDLEAKGVEVAPTLWIGEDDSNTSLKRNMIQAGWKKAVVKPRISATAHKTQLVTIEEADLAQRLLDTLRTGPGVMVQKFLEGIVTEGEWSLIFFDGVFSHAVLKKATPGDFRVQNDFGGTFGAARPSQSVLENARKIVQSVNHSVYARVDGVVDEGRFLLMELELIEPALFLGCAPDAASRFAKAVDCQIRNQQFHRS